MSTTNTSPAPAKSAAKGEPKSAPVKSESAKKEAATTSIEIKPAKSEAVQIKTMSPSKRKR